VIAGVIPHPVSSLRKSFMEDHHDNVEHPYVTSVPDAGRTYLNLGRGASYEAARRGEIPTIRVGRKLLVPVQQMKRMVEGT
jgi:excisionase family DNA binding protein